MENRNTYNQVAEYNHRVSTTNSVSNLFSIIIDEVCTLVVVWYLVAYIVADNKKQR